MLPHNTKTNNLKISIILPHYNCTSYLNKSVGSILTQTYENLELLLIDDNSNNQEWLKEIEEFKDDIRLKVYKSNVRVGPYRLKNRILKIIKSPIVGFQDSDDYSHPDRILRQIKYLIANNCDLVGTGFSEIDENGNVKNQRILAEDVNKAQKTGNDFLCLHPTTIMKTRFLKKLNGFDGTTIFAADTEFHHRSTYYGKVRNINEILYHYRFRNDSLTQSKLTGFNSILRKNYVNSMNLRLSAMKLENKQTGQRLFKAKSNDMFFEVSPIYL